MMKLSVVVPIFNQEKDIVSFVDSLKKKIVQHTNDYDIILTTNQNFDYVEKLRSRLNDYYLVAVKETDDYQQVVMAGVDKVDGDATIIMSPTYDVNIIDKLIEDWQSGKQVVCLRRKHNKFGKFIAKLRLRIYNLFLFLFGDIFSIGILKDAQLLDKEIVDKMKEEQDMAHRFRTMYAPLDYNSSVHEIEHPIEKFETRGTPHFDFWLGAVGAFITFMAVITCIALAIELAVPIWVWTLFIIFGMLFEFIFVALLVNATARVKIGILHNVDENGRIYNLSQEYYPVKPIVEEKSKATRKRILNDEKGDEKPKTTRKKAETKTNTKKVEQVKKTTTKKTNKVLKEQDNVESEVKEEKLPLKTTTRKKVNDSESAEKSQTTTKKSTTKKVGATKETEKVEVKKTTPIRTTKSKENAEKLKNSTKKTTNKK